MLPPIWSCLTFISNMRCTKNAYVYFTNVKLKLQEEKKLAQENIPLPFHGNLLVLSVIWPYTDCLFLLWLPFISFSQYSQKFLKA